MANSMFSQDKKEPFSQKKNLQALPQPLTLFSSDVSKSQSLPSGTIPESSVEPTAVEFKLNSSVARPGRRNTGKCKLNVKKILWPVISFLGMMTSSPWGREREAPEHKPWKHPFGDVAFVLMRWSGPCSLIPEVTPSIVHSPFFDLLVSFSYEIYTSAFDHGCQGSTLRFQDSLGERTGLSIWSCSQLWCITVKGTAWHWQTERDVAESGATRHQHPRAFSQWSHTGGT